MPYSKIINGCLSALLIWGMNVSPAMSFNNPFRTPHPQTETTHTMAPPASHFATRPTSVHPEAKTTMAPKKTILQTIKQKRVAIPVIVGALALAITTFIITKNKKTCDASTQTCPSTDSGINPLSNVPGLTGLMGASKNTNNNANTLNNPNNDSSGGGSLSNLTPAVSTGLFTQ